MNFVTAQRYVLQKTTAGRTLTLQLTGTSPGQIVYVDSYDFSGFPYTVKFGPTVITTISASFTSNPRFSRTAFQVTSDGLDIKLFGAADPNAQYLTLGNTSSLSQERLFTPGTGLRGTDAGANSTYTLAIDNSVVATLSGSRFTGPVSASAGLSGSLQQVTTGLSYLVGAGSVTITSQSNGQLIISASANQFITQSITNTIISGGTGDPFARYLVTQATGSLFNERVLTMGTGLTSSDGGAGNPFTISLDQLNLTGSLTKISGGLAYLITSGSVTTTTQANGQVLIQTPQFAQNFFYTGSTTPFHNGTTPLLSALQMTASNLVSGTYRLSWAYLWRANVLTAKHFFQCELFIGTTSSWIHHQLSPTVDPDQRIPASGFTYLSITGSVQTFDLRCSIQVAATNTTASMYDRTLELWRVL